MTESNIDDNSKDWLDLLTVDDPVYYEAFVQFCKDNRISPSAIPTYGQWLDLVGTESDIYTKLQFDVKPATVATMFGSFSSALNGIGINAETQDSFIRSAGTILKQQINQNAFKTGSRIFQKFGNSANSGGGDGGTSLANYMGGSSWNLTGLSLKNKPITADFDAEIRFIGADKYYLDGAEANTPLLLKCGVPGLILHGTDFHFDTTLENYFQGPIVNYYQRAIAQRVTYSNAVNSQFDADAIRAYINHSLQACCTYYFWASILAYTADTRNKNTAMEKLSNSLTPAEKDKLVILKKAIEQAVIPPFIHKWAFYIMGNFKQSEVPGAPMTKFMPWNFKNNTTGHVFTEMATYISDGVTYGSISSATANIDEIRSTMDVLGAAFPDWCNMDVFEYTSIPEVDMNFNNVWCNSLYTTMKKTANSFALTVLPSITSVGDAITWNSQTDAPRGWTQAMQSVAYVDGTAPRIGPGFFTTTLLKHDGTEAYANSHYVLNDGSGVPCPAACSCLIYEASTPGSEGFVDVGTLARYQSLAKNTYSATQSSISTHAHQKHGCALIKLQTIDVIRQSCFAWLDLYTSDLKDAPPSDNYKKNSGKGKGKSRYSRGSKKSTPEKEEES